MLEVILVKEGSVLHLIAVEHVATYGILTQYTRCPLPELGGTDTVDAVVYGDNSIETLELGVVSFPIFGSMCKICTYSFFNQFT